jgi:carboxypeptidase PM20D1
MITRILLIASMAFVAVGLPIVVRTQLFRADKPAPVSAMREVPFDIDAAASRLSKAIQIRTLSESEGSTPSNENITALHALLEQQFPLVHANLRRETVNRHSLLYTWQGSDPSLAPALFVAHQDVVPVEPGTEADWSHPPFSGAIDDGYIWGRGGLDMKQTLMGLLEAVEGLIAAGFQPARTVLLAFGHDEEVGGRQGAREIARTLRERGVELEFVLDEGMAVTHGIVPGVKAPAALIGIAEKGYANLQLVVEGAGGHSSNPPRQTVVGLLGRALVSIEENPMPAKITDITLAMFRHLASDLPLSMRAALANLWLLEPTVIARMEATNAGNATVRTTITPTILAGGVKANVVPQEAAAVLNVRLLPGDTAEEVVRHITSLVDDPAFSVRPMGADVWDASPTVSDISSEAFGAIAESIRTMFPNALVAPGLVIGATDSRHYVNIAKNAFRFLPIRLESRDLARFHGTDERIAVAVYGDSIRFYADLMQRLTWTDGGGN